MIFRKPDFLLLFIILVAIVLRFYGFPNIPFMYDEVSAWARTGFGSFHELMERGVKGDGHPAGIQVFLYYWRMVAGDSEAAFKFPFLVMGVLSVWMVFRIGKFWFTNTVGYLTAAFMATLQYTVMYSQIARPYVSGLFFSLMMVWCWTNYFFNPAENRKRSQLVGFTIFAVLCCYDHYFSMLFAGMVGITGLFFLNRQNWKGYLLSGIIVALLFLPHLSITIFQFGIGGVGGWLAKPTPQFVSDYFHYLYHFSAAVKWMAILLVLLSILFYNKEIRSQQKFRIISLVWFLVPFLTGYYYSVYRNAVLQYSVLIFSFPYLLLFVFSLYRELKLLYNAVLVSAVMFACIYTLVFKREYYNLFYRQPVEQLVKNAVTASKESRSKNCTVLINEPRKYAGYYLEKYHSDLPMDYWAEKNFQTYIEFRKYLSSLSSDCFMAGNIPVDYLMLVKEFYPYKINRAVGFTYSFNCFSKSKTSAHSDDDRVFQDSLDLDHPATHWDFDPRFVKHDSATYHSFFPMDSTREYGPTFISQVHPLITNGFNVLNVSMHVRNVKPGITASLVVSFEKNKKSVFWQEKPFALFMDSSENGALIFYSISLRDMGVDVSNAEMKAFAWNKDKEAFDIDDMHVDFESGNPWIYGLIEPIPRLRP